MKLQVFISKIYSFSCIYFFVVFCVFADRTWSKVHSCSTPSNQASQGKSAAVGEWMWLPESFLSYFISTWFLSFWFPSCFFFPHSPTFARSFLFFSFFLSSLLSFLISANFQSCILFPPSHCLYHSLLSLHLPAAQLLFVYFQSQPLIGRNSPSFSFHSIHVHIHIHIHIHHYSLFTHTLLLTPIFTLNSHPHKHAYYAYLTSLLNLASNICLFLTSSLSPFGFTSIPSFFHSFHISVPFRYFRYFSVTIDFNWSKSSNHTKKTHTIARHSKTRNNTALIQAHNKYNLSWLHSVSSLLEEALVGWCWPSCSSVHTSITLSLSGQLNIDPWAVPSPWTEQSSESLSSWGKF